MPVWTLLGSGPYHRAVAGGYEVDLTPENGFAPTRYRAVVPHPTRDCGGIDNEEDTDSLTWRSCAFANNFASETRIQNKCHDTNQTQIQRFFSGNGEQRASRRSTTLVDFNQQRKRTSISNQ